MDALDYPEWVLDIQRAAHGMMFGRIPLELVVAQGKITKVIGSKSMQTKFRDTKEAQVFMLDHIRTKLKEAGEPDAPNKQDGTSVFTVVHKGDKITQINTFDTVEYNYPM